MKEQRKKSRITAKNTNLEILKKHFSHCFNRHGDGELDFAKLKTELSNNKGI